MTNDKSLTAKKGLPDFLKKWATLFPLIFPELFGSTSFGIVNIVYHPALGTEKCIRERTSLWMFTAMAMETRRLASQATLL